MARSSTFVALILLAHNIQRTAGHGAMLTPTPRNAIDSTIPGMDWGNGTTKTGKMEPLSVQVDLSPFSPPHLYPGLLAPLLRALLSITCTHSCSMEGAPELTYFATHLTLLFARRSLLPLLTAPLAHAPLARFPCSLLPLLAPHLRSATTGPLAAPRRTAARASPCSGSRRAARRAAPSVTGRGNDDQTGTTARPRVRRPSSPRSRRSTGRRTATPPKVCY